MIEAGLSASIIGRAREAGLISVQTINIRDFTNEKHGHVDDAPYGGGAGMVMQCQPIYDAFAYAEDKIWMRSVRVSFTPHQPERCLIRIWPKSSQKKKT